LAVASLRNDGHPMPVIKAALERVFDDLQWQTLHKPTAVKTLNEVVQRLRNELADDRVRELLQDALHDITTNGDLGGWFEQGAGGRAQGEMPVGVASEFDAPDVAIDSLAAGWDLRFQNQNYRIHKLLSENGRLTDIILIYLPGVFTTDTRTIGRGMLNAWTEAGLSARPPGTGVWRRVLPEIEQTNLEPRYDIVRVEGTERTVVAKAVPKSMVSTLVEHLAQVCGGTWVATEIKAA
jgi:hypothetical protein